MIAEYEKFLKSIILSIIINIVITFITHFIDMPFVLNENQILYIFASVAQVTGGLFGLIFTAYTLIDDKFKKINNNDESAVDYCNQIRKENFISLISISILSICSIVMTLLVLFIYRNDYLDITIFFILESLAIFVLLLINIFNFICKANPDNIVLKGEKEKELIDFEYSTNSSIEEISFGSFITYYNILENNIKKIAQKQLPKNNGNIHFQILDALSVLQDSDIISKKCFAQINELRRYRNSLVHSTEENKYVNPTLFEILKNLCDLFIVINSEIDTQTYSDAKKKLDDYVNNIPLKIDEKLILYLKENPKATIIDMANYLSINNSEARRRLQKLVDYGYVKKNKDGKYITYNVID